MRTAPAALALLLLDAPVCARGNLPDPLFWETRDDFYDQVEDGQFNRRIELHLLQYAADPGWRFDWAASRYAGNGLLGEFGSTTTKELYVDSQIAINVFPTRWLQLRYDRRDLEDGRFELSGQRLDAVFQVGPAWGVALSGWPTFDKERSSLGAGLRLGAPRSPDMLELRVLDERWIWNDKTSGGVRFSGHPLRLLADGSGAAGPWRVRGSVDWGLPYQASDHASGEAAPDRTTGGFQRLVDLEAQYAADGGWGAGLRFTGARLERWQSAPAEATLSLDRCWGRAAVAFRRVVGPWSASGLAAWASQRDDFASPGDPAGTYAADVLIGGVEAGWQASDAFQLRLGYLGSWQRVDRNVSGHGALPPRSGDGYLDKAHLRALYVFQPRMSIELLLSQSLTDLQFGGGSVKALLAF